MKTKVALIIILFSVQFACHIYGQQFVIIKGKLTDANTYEPVGFVSISVKNSTIGTVSNTKGDFVFHVPKANADDTLLISCIGFQSYYIAINDIENQTLNLKLNPRNYELSEVLIKPIDPLEIIKKAINKIPENYPTKPINMNGFYREMTFENNNCVEMAEAASEFYYRPYIEDYNIKNAVRQIFTFSENHYDYFITYLDMAFQTNPNDRLKIIESRASNLLHKKRFKVVPRGGVLSCTSFDLVKIKAVMISKKDLKKAKYKLVDITSYNNHQVYVISYKSKTRRLNEGLIYIDVKSLAFIGFKLRTLKPQISIQTTRYWTPALYKKKREKCKDTEKLKNEVINIGYKEINGKWYLNTISTELDFDYVFSEFYVHQNKDPRINYKISRELLINDVKIDKIDTISEKDNFPNSVYSILYEQDLNYNPVFWENYNSIKTTPLQDSIIKQLEFYKPIENQFKEQFIKNDSIHAPIARIEFSSNPNTGLPDNYYWMQDITNPEVLSYVEAENKYAENEMLPIKPYKRNLYNEMLQRIERDTIDAPELTEVGNYVYYYKNKPGTSFENLYRKNIQTGKETLVFDIAKLKEKNENFIIQNFYVNQNNELIAYTENFGLGYENKLVVTNISTGEKIEEIDKVSYIIWKNYEKEFYYLTWDSTNRNDKLILHKIGEKPEKDRLIYYEKDKQKELSFCTYDNKWLILESTDNFYYNEIFLCDLNGKDAKIEKIVNSCKGYNHYIKIYADTLYSLSNENEVSKIYYSPINKPQKENWQTLIQSDVDEFFDSFIILTDYFVVRARKNLAYCLKIFSKNGAFIKEIKFKEPTFLIRLFFDTKLQAANKFRYSYSSLTTPQIIYEYVLNSNKQKVIKQQNIKGYNKEDYKMELIWATAKDGVKIPISLIYNKKQVKLNGKSALYLTTYGSYGSPTNNCFAANRLSLLDRGVIYAIAHVRGGGELGINWHEQAMQLKKMNTFNDFIACTLYLIEKKYTSKGRIVAAGGSAGGLLMGVLANTQPGLYNSVILLSPFLDLLGSLTDSTAKFSSLDHAEFGDPSNIEIFNYVKSYSPYQNIKVKNYPNMLFYIGLNDDRVEYWQSLKSVAKLRALKTDNNKLYLKTELYAGHNGYFGNEAYCDFDAYIYAFILNNLGINY